MLLEERHGVDEFLEGIRGRLFLGRQVRAQSIVQRNHPPGPVAGGIGHRQLVSFGSQFRPRRRIEAHPNRLVGRHGPGDLQNRAVGIHPGKIRRAALGSRTLRKPRKHTIGNAQDDGFRTRRHLGGFVPRNHGKTGVGGRVAFHGHRRQTRRLGRRHSGRLVAFSLDQTDKLQSGLLACLNQRFQRLLLAGIRRPTDHQAIDRRTLHNRQ